MYVQLVSLNIRRPIGDLLQGGTSFVDRLCSLRLLFLMLSRLCIAEQGKGWPHLLVMFIVFLLLSHVVSWVRCVT